MSTYRGPEKRGGCSWGEKVKILIYSFKKLTKSLINRDKLRDCKQIWEDMLICFYLAMVIWTLGILCREKALFTLSNCYDLSQRVR